jgi:putative tricarboxylic transport membrane protein
MIAPKGLTAAQVAYWEEVMRRINESPEMHALAEKHQWDLEYMGAAETRKFMEADYARQKRLMSYMGVAK